MKSFWKKSAIAFSVVALLIGGCGNKSNPEAKSDDPAAGETISEADAITKDWVEYSPEDSRYSIKFPGEPKEESDLVVYEEGDLKYAVGVIEFPPEFGNIDNMIDQFLKAMDENGGTIESQEDVTRNGISGKKLTVSSEEAKLKVLLLVDKQENRIYQALAGTEKKDTPLTAPEIDAFLSSLEIAEVAAENSEEESSEAPSPEQASAAEAEGKTTLGAMYRAQQAYHLEKSAFASNIDDLGLGIKPETQHYKFEIVSAQGDRAYMTATAQKAEAKSFAALVFIDEVGDTSKTILCETDEVSQTPPEVPTVEGGEAKCAAGSSKV